MLKAAIILAIFAFVSGCHHARVPSLAVPDPDHQPAEIRVDKFVWGLVAPGRIDLAELPAGGCPGGITQTVEAVRWWHAITAVATAGLYTPYDLIVECAR